MGIRSMDVSARAPGLAFVARVVASHGRHFVVEDENGRLFHASRRGKRGDVLIGDRVECQTGGADQAAIEAVLPRASLIYRADAVRTQALAANVTQVAFVFAPQPAFNEWLIWRALLASQAAGVAALVVLNKTDLDPGKGAAALDRLRRLGYRGVAVCAKHRPDEARALLAPLLAGQVSLLAGQSGMGKSTLLNLLVQANERTQEFSARLNLGRQTTTASRWFACDGGALIDSPGFQRFGLAHLDPDGLARGFPEFAPHLGRCRFADCRHLREPDCAVRAALAGGAVDADRHAFYSALMRELQ